MSSKQEHHTQLLKAYEKAQWIAFSPFIFQATIAARDSGILSLLGKSPYALTIEEIAQKTQLSTYAVQVLVELLSSVDVVVKDASDGYCLTQTGECLIYDTMTEVNLNFSNDVNYQALQHTLEAIDQGKPIGLKVFNNSWTTIYPHLKELPERARRSWFAFDHFYSDMAYRDALNRLSHRDIKHFFDVGGNTGRFTKMALKIWPQATATIIDLPEQLQLMRNNPDLSPSEQLRIDDEAIDWLDVHAKLKTSRQAELIWMSQFLDCFSANEAISILKRVQEALSEDGQIAILEPLWDCQRHKASSLSLTATSLYFTVLANGNSRFFTSEELKNIIEAAGLKIVKIEHHLGISHSLYLCEKA